MGPLVSRPPLIVEHLDAATQPVAQLRSGCWRGDLLATVANSATGTTMPGGLVRSSGGVWVPCRSSLIAPWPTGIGSNSDEIGARIGSENPAGSVCANALSKSLKRVHQPFRHSVDSNAEPGSRWVEPGSICQGRARSSAELVATTLPRARDDGGPTQDDQHATQPAEVAQT